jgi:serine/threonine protein kinase/Tol biopolymer transport system component
MSLAPGTRLGPYEVLAPLGQGGMGEVWRATDAHLGRQVAIKVLPDAFAEDAERLARFEREAKTLAALNHPNIASIYAVEKHRESSTPDGLPVFALVMELVDGATLAEVIGGAVDLAPSRSEARQAAGVGPRGKPRKVGLALNEALPIARQIAEALEAAHEQGIVHRDLKPANVKVKDDGTVKVLDFGLAKALDPAQGSGLKAQGAFPSSPTITSPAMTEMGMILGTAAYMSPEQARGKPVDKRADIWAFGCVLYEMLTGLRAFEGEDVSATLAAVIRAEPEWDALPAGLSPALRTFLKRCLAKDPRLRVRDIGDLRLALDGAFDSTPGPGDASTRARSKTRLALAAAAALVASVVTGVVVWNLRGSSASVSRPVARFSIALLADASFGQNVAEPLAITPDGQRIVFNAGVKGANVAARQLYVRSLDQLNASAIPGTEGVGSAFVSPDGEWVGFYSGGADGLRKIRVTGGPAATIAKYTATFFSGATWGTDGTIVFSIDNGVGGLKRVANGGGTPEGVTTPGKGEGHVHPHFLPDGKHVLFVRRRTGEPDLIQVLDLETRTTGDVIQGSSPRYVSSGHLLFAKDETVWASAFDTLTHTIRGQPLPVLEDVDVAGSASGVARFAVSRDGTLVYAPDQSTAGVRLNWVNRDGSAVPLPHGPDIYWQPRLSPDGRRLAVGIAADIWVIDLDRGGRIRLTFGQTSLRFPFTWTPDSAFITFAGPQSNRIYRVPATGGSPEVLVEGDHPQWPTGWSADGRTLAFYSLSSTTARDLWTLAAGPKAVPALFLATPFQERSARFSSDGRWLAYVSDESGRDEVYVRPFPGPAGQVAISTDGGTEPVWSRTGRELFYRSGGAMMVVTIQTAPAFHASPPRRLFADEGFMLELSGVGGNPAYDVHPDGRFLMLTGTPVPAEARLVLNWTEDLKRLVPVK